MRSGELIKESSDEWARECKDTRRHEEEGHALTLSARPLRIVSWRYALCALLSSRTRSSRQKFLAIGVLSLSSANTTSRHSSKVFIELGYVGGKNIAIEYRWAEGNEDRLPVLAAELLRMNVDIIVATNSRGARAAQQLTKTIPIVTTAIPDPVVYGLVNSLHHPGQECNGGVLYVLAS